MQLMSTSNDTSSKKPPGMQQQLKEEEDQKKVQQADYMEALMYKTISGEKSESWELVEVKNHIKYYRRDEYSKGNVLSLKWSKAVSTVHTSAETALAYAWHFDSNERMNIHYDACEEVRARAKRARLICFASYLIHERPVPLPLANPRSRSYSPPPFSSHMCVALAPPHSLTPHTRARSYCRGFAPRSRTRGSR